MYQLIYVTYFKSRIKEPLFPTDMQAWEVAYPEQPEANEDTLRACYSKLSKLAEDFLVQLELEKHGPQLALCKNEVLFRLAKLSKANHNLEDARKTLAENDSQCLEYRYKIEVAGHRLKVQGRKRTNDTTLPKVLKTLYLYYIREKLVHYVELMAYKRILENAYMDEWIDDELQRLSKADLEAHPVIKGYVLARTMYLNPDPHDTKPMDVFRDFLLDHDVHEAVPLPDIKRLYNYLQNYSISRINGEILGAREYHFHLSRKGLTKGFLLEDGLIPPWIFKNFVTNALQVGGEAARWTKEHFIRTYKEFIPKPYKEDVLNYCDALIAFYEQNYSVAIKILQDVSQSLDHFLSIDSRILPMKIRLIQRDAAAVESLAKAFDQYLKRNREIAKDRKLGYFTQNRYFRKIAKLKTRKKAMELLGQLRGEAPFPNKKWLINYLNAWIQSGDLE